MGTIPIFTLPIFFNNPTLPTRTIYGFMDDFGRASASNLGFTSREAKPWVSSLAAGITSGIDASGAAYFARDSGGAAQVVVDSKAPNGTLLATMKVKTAPGQAGVAFRWSNAQNYFTFSTLASGAGSYRINKVVANVTTVMATTTDVIPANGDVLKVVLAGDLITCYVNGVQILQLTDTHNRTATSHGLYNTEATTVARWDDVSFTAA
ncbi:hypothetical protein ABIB35_001481 [Arthrobacter sp. UYP6]|uniref:hypothetical protein n=1 Tax=Arthrobacter sp. UYP6 TaxID=1756378 RepID=UPI003390811D